MDWVRDHLANMEREPELYKPPVITEWRDFLESVERYRKGGDLNEYEWHELVNQQELDTDAHAVGLGMSSGEFWTVECLHKFVALYDQYGGLATPTVEEKPCG